MLEHRRPSQDPGRVVVVGSAGFVGSAVMRRLGDAGLDVDGMRSADVDLLFDGAADALAERLRGADAAVLVSARAPAKTAGAIADNLRMAQAMVDALAAAPVAHVVAISSDAVYDEATAAVGPRTPAAPTSPHGAMHVAREVAFRGALGADLCVLRPTLLYGLEDPHNGYGPNRFLRQAAAEEEITLFGGGEEQRDHVSVDDVAAVVEAVLRRSSVGILDVASGESWSFADVAALAVELTGSGSTIRTTPRQNPITHRHFDVAPRLETFPSLSMTPLRNGLEAIVAARRG